MAEETKKPVFDILIDASAALSHVHVNGEDISASIRGCEVKCMAGELTTIVLHVMSPHARVTVEGTIDKEQVIVNG